MSNQFARGKKAFAVTDAIIAPYWIGVFMAKNQYTNSKMDHILVPNVCGVYLLLDKTTGRTYVGSSKNIRTRISLHFHDMQRRPDSATYRVFAKTLAAHGATAFDAELLEACTEDALLVREKHWIEQLSPTENSYVCSDGRAVYGELTRSKKSAAAASLWQDPEYRAKAVAARIGNTYSKGYKCTPEQVANRRRAARISNMKRAHGVEWKDAYIARYPEFSGDVDVK